MKKQVGFAFHNYTVYMFQFATYSSLLVSFQEGRKSPIKVESPAKNDMADISPVSLQDKLKMAISQGLCNNIICFTGL